MITARLCQILCPDHYARLLAPDTDLDSDNAIDSDTDEDLVPLQQLVPLQLDEIESTFVEGLSAKIREHLKQNELKPNLFCLRTCESMKTKFTEDVLKKFPDGKYTSQALDLESTIQSVWKKAKDRVESVLQNL